MQIVKSAVQVATHFFQYRLVPHVVVLMYHRVNELSFDPQLLHVTPRHFEEHLAILRRYAHPIRLADLHSALRVGRLPPRGVVLTFDDGYADNLACAKPLLERYDTPATFFVTTGQIDQPVEFWWDALERLILQPGKLPASLSLNINGHSYHWEDPEAVAYTKEAYQRFSDWHIERPDDPGPRQKLYRSIYHLLHSLPENERRGAIEQLQTWAGEKPMYRPTHRTLTADEVACISAGDLIEIGAHTVTHPVLAALPLAAQRAEIEQSKTRLEAIVHHPISSFSYPHGSYTEETLNVVRELEFTCACSSDTDVAWNSTDPYRIPRLVVRDWDRNEFKRWLLEMISW